MSKDGGSMMNTRRKTIVFLIGPPGVGKSTISRHLAAQLDLHPFQSGQVLRETAENAKDLELRHLVNSRMKQSLPMPVDIYSRILRENIPKNLNNGLVFDGYPRTVEQCVSIPEILEAAGVSAGQVCGFVLEAPREILLQRSSARRVCGECGRETHGTQSCCRVGSLRQRADDETERLLARSRSFHELLPPVKRAFTSRWPCFKVDASEPPAQIVSAIKGSLSTLPQGTVDL